MGMGIGIITATLVILCTGNTEMSDAEIEKAARALGMHYESECKTILNNNNIDK